MGNVFAAARQLLQRADNPLGEQFPPGSIGAEAMRFARALLAAEKAVDVARQYNIPDLVAAVAEYDEAVQ